MRPSLVTTISPKPQIRDWEAITVQLAVTVLDIANGFKSISKILPSAEARTTRVVRMIESYPDVDHDLVSLAREAKLSRYHFLRIFQKLTGLTPHFDADHDRT